MVSGFLLPYLLELNARTRKLFSAISIAAFD